MGEKQYKKFYRKTDKHLNGKVEAKHGKQINQKIKPYVVLQYLMKYTDENHTASAYDIIAFLQVHGLNAARRSIYKDIEEINKVALLLEEDITIDEAEELLFDEGQERLIVYDKHQKGFYVNQRKFDLNDIRLLAECVYSAKFIAEGQSNRLVDVVCEFVSEHQAERIRHNAFLTDRVKTSNRGVINNISTINEAMSLQLDGNPHTPTKISFKYLKHTIDNISQQVDRRHGERYIVSPFQLLINDGNYYLLAYEDKSNKLKTYRVDRIKDVRHLNEPRDGEEEFREIDLKTYTQRVFSMFSGKKQTITMRFIMPLLDTVIDRFGTKDVSYRKIDNNHFSITTKVEISEQFFGWLLGFGKRVKITNPEEVITNFKAYLDKVREMY